MSLPAVLWQHLRSFTVLGLMSILQRLHLQELLCSIPTIRNVSFNENEYWHEKPWKSRLNLVILELLGALAFNGTINLNGHSPNFAVNIASGSVSLVYNLDVYQGSVVLSGTLSNNVNLVLSGTAQAQNSNGQVINENVNLVATVTPPLIDQSLWPTCPL